ncbi:MULTISPECIES: N-acetylmuramoyl-L-alanine amidase [Xanthomonas]|uniref:N-acetylmuramoyl-L-alanine amidase n=1 Tax=Xanthomonas cannabis pv. phaseoli TaxID=1885902 RepID=A0AB34P5B4_9XANT|nr:MULTISPECIES: N-acetylmuramoyl-L-alanine amidase [Xanthomonas]KGK56752.1 N-acetylmuramoyl-L-alanine amidase [Xanthomonas cannabis pv. phaseoli]MBB3806220.1 N-acetylmuramoyl-L-alanine amidase [Xanthomonas cannabis]NIK19971.1 N-acetylmuramoyl-L-alanine amidase [Xanthomonas cannabis]PPU36072.1 N-acetylmuramoyl-L-alanine amidase [Xanthomonas sp. CFBP 7912]RJS03284.1 N-acetylmuramoyl-L-alanine amidase [Xanthomonas sp. CFBP 7698]
MSDAVLPSPPITYAPLPYESRLARRPLGHIDMVVIHCTELPDMAMARDYGERVLYDSGTGNSGHYYIDRNGSIQQYVALERVAHHVRGHNPHTLGIELVNRGRYPHWLDSRHQLMSEAYPEPQIGALITLLQWLQQQLPSVRRIAGHQELDTTQEAASDDPARKIQRKLDPGPLFPWSRIHAAVGWSHSLR